MKRVLYVTTVSRTINAFLVPHILALREKGFQVDCACSIDKELDKSLEKAGVKLYKIPFTRNPISLSNIRAFKMLDQIQKNNKYDIVHVHTPIASIYGRLLKLKHKGIKTIYTAHGYHFLEGGSKSSWLIYYPIEKVMAKLTDVTININKEDFKITQSKLKPKKSYYVKGVGLDLKNYKPLTEKEKVKKRKELNLKEEDFIVIMIAEVNENKNQIQLIKAMEILKEKYENIKAICVGDGELLKQRKEDVKNKGLENNINFLGYRTDINELINIADIGVLLSYREGLPRNIMEIMANGKKIVATNIRGNRDLVCNENVGKLVEVGDYEETAKAIEYYYLNNTREVIIPKEIEPYSLPNVVEMVREIHEGV
ncbi:glycosyltransferase family 4 protein [Clostridium tarantellae]|uniref:Glycosyltransferase n=1 Tax=Clostridium tarantellae TaxID=39493 RepID=A0A6I1MJG8_9CLOT|nr:glycosyltransferase family 4 protein [Clostridium tarantellae]MPQ42292.1 glycosyltransferase [Clostridium tarantellae]